MANAHEDEPQAQPPHPEGDGSTLKRMSRAARRRPVTTLALAAGVGALMGAELLAAGLAGGAVVLLWQRADVRGRARQVLDAARERMRHGGDSIEHHA